MTASNPPPGWYPDPAGAGGVRWWDGRGWTPQVRPAGPPPQLPQPPRRPLGPVVAALAIVGILVAFLAVQLLGALRQPEPRAPAPPPLTAAPVPTGAQPGTPLPEATFVPVPSADPTPSLRIVTGCPDPVAGTLASRAASVAVPTGWREDEAYLSFDCAATVTVQRHEGFGEFTVASVDPSWGLDEQEVIAWAWDDLGLRPDADDRVDTGDVAGRPAVTVTRQLSEVYQGKPFETTIRISVISSGRGEREVVASAVSARLNTDGSGVPADVERLWAGLRVTG